MSQSSSMIQSWCIQRVPRLWVLWAASRPSQLALIGLLYVLGVGMTTTGSPLVAGDATANTLDDVLASGFSVRILAGAVALVPVAVAVHYANEYADADTDALTDRTPFSGGSGALVETGLPASFLRTDRQTALAFWLNVYNAAAQLLLERRPELFESRWRFFRTAAITVAGIDVSLDDVEHGILRGKRSKYGLGYLPRLARSGFGPEYRLDADPRLHFALNCGAASCPAILAYDPESVDRTLDETTKSYLQQTVTYDADQNRVRAPRVCLWFIGDFGGLSGLRAFLRDYGQIPSESKPSVRFESYDWARAPRQFADER